MYSKYFVVKTPVGRFKDTNATNRALWVTKTKYCVLMFNIDRNITHIHHNRQQSSSITVSVLCGNNAYPTHNQLWKHWHDNGSWPLRTCVGQQRSASGTVPVTGSEDTLRTLFIRKKGGYAVKRSGREYEWRVTKLPWFLWEGEEVNALYTAMLGGVKAANIESDRWATIKRPLHSSQSWPNFAVDTNA